MTALTDTRKRSRDEDTCHFMPISKRINNLTINSQGFGEQNAIHSQNVAPNFFMAINNQEAQHSLFNSHPNNMPHSSNYHQSHVVPTTNHSNGFHHGSHLALGTNAHKQNHHPHHSYQPHVELNNNQMEEEIYSPDLTPAENPFYYDKNKLLFDLHVERERRHQNH